MAKQDPENDGIEIAEFELGEFRFVASSRLPFLKKADDESDDEKKFEAEQIKGLRKIEQSPEHANEHKRIMRKLEREDLIRQRLQRSKDRAAEGLSPYAPDEPNEANEEFEIMKEDDIEQAISEFDTPADVAPAAPAVPAAPVEKGKHAGGRPKDSKIEGTQGAETSETRQDPWSEDTLVNLRSMLLTRQELLEEYGFSAKEMIRIFEEKPDEFLRDIVFKNLDKINVILKKKEQAAIEKSEISNMNGDDIEELLYKKLGDGASRFLPEDLSPEWWRFLHDEVPVATEGQKSKLAKLMAEASEAKYSSDLLGIQVDEALGQGSDRKSETKRLTSLLSEKLEEKFKQGLSGIETHFIEDKTGQDLRKYLEKYDKLTDVDIFAMTKYYETMKTHYSALKQKLTETLDDIKSGDFDKESYSAAVKVPDLLEQGEAGSRESAILDQIIGQSRPGGAKSYEE